VGVRREEKVGYFPVEMGGWGGKTKLSLGGHILGRTPIA